METKEQLLAYLKEIETWEKKQKDLFFWEKLGRLPFKLLDKFTPKLLQKKIAELMDELGSFIQTGGKYLVSERTLFKQINQISSIQIKSIEEIRNLPIEVMMNISDKLAKNRATIATMQGATTGVGGLFTLIVDIPVILGLSLKTLQEIAMIY